MSFFFRLLLFTLALSVATAGCGSQVAVIARVNDKAITKTDLLNAIDELRQQNRNEKLPEPGTSAYAEIEKRVLQRLINDEVIRLEADRMGIAISEEEGQARLDQQKASSGSEAQFAQNLSEQGTSLEQLTQNIRSSLMFEKIFSQTTKDVPEITDEQALEYYKQASSGQDPAGTVPFDQAKAGIKARLDQENKSRAFQLWLAAAKDRNQIVIDEEYR